MNKFLTWVGIILCIEIALIVPAIYIFNWDAITIRGHTFALMPIMIYVGIAFVIINVIAALMTPDDATLYEADYWTDVVATASITITALYVAVVLVMDASTTITSWRDIPTAKLLLFGLLIGTWLVMLASKEKHFRITRALAVQRAAPPALRAPAPVAPPAAPVTHAGRGLLWLAILVVLGVIVLAVFPNTVRVIVGEIRGVLEPAPVYTGNSCTRKDGTPGREGYRGSQLGCWKL